MEDIQSKEFNIKKEKFNNMLLEIQKKHESWFNDNLGYYKDNSRPTIVDYTFVNQDQGKITFNIDLKLPTEIQIECGKAFKDTFEI